MQGLPIRFIDDNRLVDKFKRRYQYLRLSITDVCNFRCNYCLPNGYQGKQKNNFLRLEEINRLIRAFANLGTEKIRITGGEPTLRRDFNQVVETIRQHSAIQQIGVTTNGYRMQRAVESWQASGVDTINLSIDSLDRNLFQQITGEDLLPQVLAGIDKAFAIGYKKIKVNAVLMRGINDQGFYNFLQWIKYQPIQMRFIELMQTGTMDQFFNRHHLRGEELKERLLNDGWQPQKRGKLDGPAQVFRHPDYIGEVGLIMPYSQDFCASCNRLRVSANGEFHLCLFGAQGYNIRHLLQNDKQQLLLQQSLQTALGHKRENHLLHVGDSGVRPHLASIGG